jgi:hypothetical protein
MILYCTALNYHVLQLCRDESTAMLENISKIQLEKDKVGRGRKKKLGCCSVV